MKYLPGILLILALMSCNHEAEKTELQTQIEILQHEKDSLIQVQHQLEDKMDSVNPTSGFWFSNKIEGKPLLEAGIENPGEYIVNALKQRPELIPLEPVLGGQMKFRKVKLLGKGCLIAYYEDGHKGGKSIYSYKFSNGELFFKLIKTCAE